LSKTEKQKMLAGELYQPGSSELQADQAANKRWLARYNAAMALPVSERHALLSEHLGHVGADAVVRPPFFCDYGYNIHLGDGVFLNFNCVILDVVAVSIGDRTQVGPAVQIYAADHPEMQKPGATVSNSDDRYGSVAMSGLAAAPLSCPASRSAMGR
jgi:maltose O-acetyltransferase